MLLLMMLSLSLSSSSSSSSSSSLLSLLLGLQVIQLLSEVAKAGMAQKSSSSECALPIEWTPQQDDLELKVVSYVAERLFMAKTGSTLSGL